MTRKKSDFVEDRLWNVDIPDDDSTLKEKLDYQRKLRQRWDQAANEPPDFISSIPLPGSGSLVDSSDKLVA
jgi:hypothetical protein